MTKKGKQLSNPFSTGAGGPRFETHVQASFVTLMITGGFAPCFRPPLPIVEIKLQGAVSGYGTDDLVVFVENPANGERRRLLCQVKHSIRISEKNDQFAEIIQAAWRDFNNPDVFTKDKDIIALITGPISATDTDGVNKLLEHARHTTDTDQFLTMIRRGNFCSNTVRSKLNAFKVKLNSANNDNEVSDKDLHEFLRHFHLLGYDLDKPGSVLSSLIQSHIAQFNKEIPDKIWYQTLSVVQDFNQNAGTITVESLPDDLVKYFKKPEISYISEGLLTEEERKDDVSDGSSETEWNHHRSASKLAIAILIGSWNENSKADLAVIEQLIEGEYRNWIKDLREMLQIPDCPLRYKNGIWSFKDRLKSWEELGSRFFDDQLEAFKTVALDVLQVDDPSFELPAGERYAAAIYEKILPHSDNIREGLAETLALIGSRSDILTNCSSGKADLIAAMSIHELFKESNWIRWGSLNSLLPTLSEAHPDEFLSAVETAIGTEPSPFDTLFKQEDAGVFGRSYISGLLWALEGIAWDSEFLSRTSVVLAEIASHDPGGNWSNRPSNSLADIFLPWMPHTLATVEKRQAAIRTICIEQPEVGWKLLESLLPNQLTTTSGSYKPKWRNTIPEDWAKGVTNREYWDQAIFCAELIVEQAGYDVMRLASLVGIYDSLPSPASETLREKLLSDYCLNLTEQERMPIWNRLSKFIAYHRQYSDAKWSLENEPLLQLEEIENKLAPSNPSLRHRQLFSDADYFLYEDEDDWQEKRFQIRKTAIEEILDEGGIKLVLEFVSHVKDQFSVGDVLADFDRKDFDADLLPEFLDMKDHGIWFFISSYAWRRVQNSSWKWFDEIDKSEWEPRQIAYLLCALPFDRDAWDRSAQLLGENEDEYWKNIKPNLYQMDDEYPFYKLLEYGRPSTVIKGLGNLLIHQENINPELACEALLDFVQSDEQAERIDSHYITKIIQALQQNSDTDQDKLFQVEWAYVSLLGSHGEGSPATLVNKLTSDPEFFCELIQFIYRSEGDDSQKEPSEQSRNIATNAYRLLSTWSVVPGTQQNGSFNPNAFLEWLKAMEEKARSSGHYNVAMTHLGRVLVNAPEENDGLWIHSVIANAMNQRDRSALRNGFFSGVLNARGAHWIDPEAKPEKELADKFRRKADELDNSSFQRLATTLREIATSYENEAERILSDERYH